ncbi:MAG: PQQ-binding-like beta-propeller repeat protein [candidate division WOR-3 bacterium]
MRNLTLTVILVTAGFAWDVELVRIFNLGSHGMSATGIYDLDGDSIPEILIPGNSQLYCYDTSGSLHWQFTPLSHYFPAVSSPIAADIDDNGTIEVVFSTPAAVYVLSATGSVIWSRPLDGEGGVQNCISSVALGDINQDRRLEVLAYEVYASRLLCLNPVNGETIWTYQPMAHPRFAVGTPTVADLNLDGTPEILGQFADSISGGYLYCLNAAGQELWHYNTLGSGISGWQLASAAVADLDGDDTLEIVTTANYWGVVCLNHRGQEKWRRSVSQHAAAYPAIADIDCDDTLEIVTALGPAIRCFSGPDGRDRWSFNVDSGYYIVSSPALADLDGDQRLEIIFAEVKQNNPADPNRPVWIINYQGQPLWNDTIGTTMSDPTCGDLNHDGRMEFLIGPTLRGGSYFWFRVDTAAVIPGTITWPTLQHDPGRTGWYEYQSPGVAVKEPASAPTCPSAGLQAYPNPFTLRVCLQTPPPLRELRIFDTAGRMVASLQLNNGYTVWEAEAVRPGIYFCRTTKGTLRLVKAAD